MSLLRLLCHVVLGDNRPIGLPVNVEYFASFCETKQCFDFYYFSHLCLCFDF